jgi:hypothetical protein
VSVNSSNQPSEQRISSLSSADGLQILVSPNNEVNEGYEENKTSDINDQQTIRVELLSDNKASQQLTSIQGKDTNPKILYSNNTNPKKQTHSKDTKSS